MLIFTNTKWDEKYLHADGEQPAAPAQPVPAPKKPMITTKNVFIVLAIVAAGLFAWRYDKKKK